MNIQGTDIEMETSYKYLGVHLNYKLDWTDHTATTYKKGQNRVHLLRKVRSFGPQGDLLTSFYDSVVASAIFYGAVCWRSSNSAAGRRRLDKLIKRARFILGTSGPGAGGGREQDDGQDVITAGEGVQPAGHYHSSGSLLQ